MIEEILQEQIQRLPYSCKKEVLDFVEFLIAKTESLSSQKENSDPSLFERIMKISKHCSSLPDVDLRSPDEILNYNHFGVSD